ncbi:uncharacterized protein CDAR_85121 [Caerostris darwini]|uniref:Uncharacterized protein n=1 Tax=Caerostris darwini TaxID=1538125 RepID=A0AAV4MZN1_9ARAC|nr:uncharacterized protein CDAR_85121 [Caerostris darwini]
MSTLSLCVQHRKVIRSNQLHLIPPDGTVPSEKDRLLYKWVIQTDQNISVTTYTSVPLMQTEVLLVPGILTVSVSVNNKATSQISFPKLHAPISGIVLQRAIIPRLPNFKLMRQPSLPVEPFLSFYSLGKLPRFPPHQLARYLETLDDNGDIHYL